MSHVPPSLLEVHHEQRTGMGMLPDYVSANLLLSPERIAWCVQLLIVGLSEVFLLIEIRVVPRVPAHRYIPRGVLFSRIFICTCRGGELMQEAAQMVQFLPAVNWRSLWFLFAPLFSRLVSGRAIYFWSRIFFSFFSFSSFTFPSRSRTCQGILDQPRKLATMIAHPLQSTLAYWSNCPANWDLCQIGIGDRKKKREREKN